MSGKDACYQCKQDSIDNSIETTRIKPNFASLNKRLNPYKACIYRLCRDFLCINGYVLGKHTVSCLIIKLYLRIRII